LDGVLGWREVQAVIAGHDLTEVTPEFFEGALEYPADLLEEGSKIVSLVLWGFTDCGTLGSEICVVLGFFDNGED
jgi:hypothetical protein